jgi:spermidine synthase
MSKTAAARPPAAIVPALLVFGAGACLMCVEIVGGMAIAPYFGSHVYVWGSVIAVFMGALSVGFVIGGRVADVYPRAWLLPVLTLAAGGLVLVVPLVGADLCRWLLGMNPGPGWNALLPLCAVIALYFLPGMLLGMIVPVAVRIAATALSMVGRVVGKLYALNALGSVAGALAATFLLVPFAGIRAIMFGCGVFLVVLAAACLWFERVVPSRPAVADARSPEAKSAPIAGVRPLVFGCGAVFMSFEVVGGMVIAPYFGSNVYVWGSVITLFLCSLSVGYRVGGLLADRRPRLMTLATIVVAAGVAVLVVPFVAPAVCGFAATLVSGQGARALVASVILYAVPTVLLAMVSPFAVRLSTQHVRSVGGVSGKLYALSTLGNVAGVLLTTFVLISLMGKTTLLAVGGCVTVLLAVSAVFLHNRAAGERRQPVLVSALLLLAVVALAVAPKPDLVPLAGEDEEAVGTVDGGWTAIRYRRIKDYFVLRRLVEQRESPYHHVAVIDEKALPVGGEFKTDDGRTFLVGHTTSFGNRRELQFDQYIESSVLLDDDAEHIRRPYTPGTTYSDLLHVPLVFHPTATDVLVVGGGGGAVPMTFRKSYPRMSIDVVEIDPVVVDVATEYFGLKPDDRLRVFVQDGRMFVHNSDAKYDVIILDAYTAGGRIPFHLTTREFLADVLAHLRPKGVVLMNVISGLEGRASELFRAEYKTFRRVFGTDHVYVFPKLSPDDWDLTVSRNVMLVATGPAHGRRMGESEIVERARRLCAAGTIKMSKLPEHAANMFSRDKLEQIPLDDVPVLTDNYAPVDMMIVE